MRFENSSNAGGSSIEYNDGMKKYVNVKVKHIYYDLLDYQSTNKITDLDLQECTADDFNQTPLI